MKLRTKKLLLVLTIVTLLLSLLAVPALAAGGVAANKRIRGDLERSCRENGLRLYLPPLSLCGDNGAMIGSQAYYEYLAGNLADMRLNAYANLEI